MRGYKLIVVLGLSCLLSQTVQAQEWLSHFAYNNVTQIAMADECVYAISDGSLYSVDKSTEQIHIYNSQSGLHGTNITCIGYDDVRQQLIIGYETGKIDVLSSRGVQYISELYDKDMTQGKTIYNITFDGHIAYLSTQYGIQTFDLRERKLVNSYWLRPGGQETPVRDALIANDSIYAFTDDSLFCAALSDNLVDYRFWKREKRSSRILPDSNKGVHYTDATSDWYAGGAEGIIREMATGRLSYKPQGPISNTPYSLCYAQGCLYMVPGGRWTERYKRPGMVMIYNNDQWTNIETQTIIDQSFEPVQDFTSIAVDPQDKNHFFVTSYGTGLYEFQGSTLLHRYLPSADNPIQPAASDILHYTRLDNALYDKEGNLWFLDAGAVDYQFICLDKEGQWHGLPLKTNDQPVQLHTPGGLIIDNRFPNRKWVTAARYNTNLFLMDDGGTPFDPSDDRAIGRHEWVTSNGIKVSAAYIYAFMQSKDGRIWLGTDQGVIIIDAETDYFASDVCERPQLADQAGENPMTELQITALCEDKEGKIWVGTKNLGVYVLNSTATEIAAHYTTSNSAMPANGILSIACDENGTLFIGTGGGLVEYRPHASPENSSRMVDDEGYRLGSVMQWRLHFSYEDPQELVATPNRIYACAHGALFYYNRASGQLEYFSKANGLNGSTIAQIGYDKKNSTLVIAYEDGRLDLLDADDDIRQMPDLQIKASTRAVTVNSVTAGSRHTYLGVSFGVVALNIKKGEVSDTYYIGDDAGDVDVLEVVELGDSLYAFTDGFVYSASLKDELADYSFWHKSALPDGKLKQAVAFQDELHILVDYNLYRYHNGIWQKAMDDLLQWIHVSDGQMMTYIYDYGIFRVDENYQLIGLTNQYIPNDGLYTKGEYWLAEQEGGLVHLSADGDEIYHPEGPNSNFGYNLQTAHGRVYATIGGRWASQYMRAGKVNIYDGNQWTGIKTSSNEWALFDPTLQQWVWPLDPVSIAVDPNDPNHFYIATYGTGLYEYNHGTVTAYSEGINGSTLKVATNGIDPYFFTRVDGAMTDEQGNLWVLNATDIGQPVHVVTPDHIWHPLYLRSEGKTLTLTTPSGIWVDNRNTNRKWFLDQRYSPGVILLDDGGTPARSSDDRCLKRSTFVDQNGHQLSPASIFCFAQDNTDRIWIGTQSGIILIPSTTDFFTSNACQRIIIPRNDGTGLGDYLLGDEQIKCMAVDGGNRMWIGTAGSGLYVIEDDTITAAHFTEDNSMLPSNTIQSICIVPETGEVFVGTDKGIASYLSDASAPHEDMSEAYAYPNPVPPDYGGVISITGLMENTEVNIIDSGGNLVCKTRSHGGTAVWDGRLSDGRLATPGVYTAMCNATGGHAAVKILVIR